MRLGRIVYHMANKGILFQSRLHVSKTMAFSYRVTLLNCFLSAKEEVAKLVFAFRKALVYGWATFFNGVRYLNTIIHN